jgi:hypothetical protein
MNDVLALGGSTSATLSGLDTKIRGFNGLTIEAGADWTVKGTLSGTGALTIGKGAQLTLTSDLHLPTAVFQQGGNETLTLGAPHSVTSTFSGFGSGDIFNLIGVQASTFSYAGGTLTLLNEKGAVVDTLLFSGAYHQSDFALQAQGNNTEILFAGQDAGIAGVLAPDFLTGGVTADLALGLTLSPTDPPNAAAPLEHDHPVSLLSFGAPSDLPVALWDHAGAS